MNATEHLPEPLVPVGLVLGDFAWMPIEINRLQRSKAWLICRRRPELGFFMLNLWLSAWHETPAGSLEDDDDVLADRAMCDPAKWAKVRELALRGWVKCADGRLYHPVVAEKAREAWAQKQAQRQRTEAARTAREQKRLQLKPQNQSEGSTETVAVSVTEPATGSNRPDQTGTDQTGQDQNPRRPPAAPSRGGDDGRSVAARVCEALREAGVPNAQPNAALRELLDAGADAAELVALVPQCLDKGEPYPYLLQAATNQRRRAAQQGAGMHRGRLPALPSQQNGTVRTLQRFDGTDYTAGVADGRIV